VQCSGEDRVSGLDSQDHAGIVKDELEDMVDGEKNVGAAYESDSERKSRFGRHDKDKRLAEEYEEKTDDE
jgi:hypothetical protein